MEVFSSSSFLSRHALTDDILQQRVPAIYAGAPDHGRTSARYTFISTAEVLAALREAGFSPTAATQMRTRRSGAPEHARHMVRLSHVRGQLTSLVDAVPQIVLINAHDGSSAYTLHAGLYRPVCTNGLLTHVGDFGLIHVPHRGDVTEQVVAGAIAISNRFADIGQVVERMHLRQLDERERWDFAAAALRIRYQRSGQVQPIAPDALLLPRRAADYGRSLWLTFNTVQEAVMRGGVVGRTVTGRQTRTRPIQAIREDVRINLALWQLAMSLIQV